MKCKPTYTYLITQDKQFGDTIIYNHMQGTKPKHATGASNFQCEQFKYKLPQGGTLDIRYKLDDSIDLA